jgi:3'-5' exoribonuclease
LEQTGIKEKLLEVCGGARNHHAYRAGLLAHLDETTKIALQISNLSNTLFPNVIDEEVLYASCILHDIGKALQYNSDTLVWEEDKVLSVMGHPVYGALLVVQLWPKGGASDLKWRIYHAVISHHGSLEAGAPVVPKTSEAIILHHADAISAALDVFRKQEKEGKSEYSKMLECSPLLKEKHG